MKKKMLAVFCAACMVVGMMAGCGGSSDDETTAAPKTTEAAEEDTTEAADAAEDTTEAAADNSDMLIALITMDSIDQHWVTLNEGAQEAAKELGVEVQFMAPNTKDDAQQIECVNNAVSAGADAIIVAANGPDAISSALQEAVNQGIKLVYVDSPANVDAEATFSTDNEAAGKLAGEEMIKALEEKRHHFRFHRYRKRKRFYRFYCTA